jgi:serine/threonine-protein kinase HipA
VQLLPPDREPTDWNQVVAQPLTEAELARALRDVTAPPPLGRADDGDEFRISIAGAQEKTAFLQMGGKWYRPQNATPTTHIMKLPLGIIGNFRGDFSDSVENEWLCAQLLRELRLPVADTQMARFGEQRVLVVKRFDRRWVGVDESAVKRRGFKPARGHWIARLPQEDFCQATGRAPTQKYEADGGPSIDEILGILAGSDHAEQDREQFVLAQLAYWLLAATDGHGKNFSLHHSAGASFQLTPLYDVLSAWPVIGRGANHLALQDAKLAMAMRGRRGHYKLNEIQVRRWQALALRAGGVPLWQRMQEMVGAVDAAINRVEGALPTGYPEAVFEKIARGVREQARRFLGSHQHE